MEIILLLILGLYVYKRRKYKKMLKERQNEIHLENIKRYKEEDKKASKKPITIEIKETFKKITEIKPIKKEEKQHYKKKTYITTKTELELYKILLGICEKYKLALFIQVALYELIMVNERPYSREYAKYFNSIRAKSIDFVIADKETTRIRLCIELDDPTHKKKKRIERDNFINSLFEELQIDLLRIDASNEYNINEIESKIRSTCTDIYY